MSTLIIGAVLVSGLGSALACMALGSFFTTLLSAFTLTGRAGVERLEEKYPQARKRLEAWAPHWDVIRSMLLFCAMSMRFATIAFAALAVQAAQPAHWPLVLILLLFIVLLLIFVWRILPLALAESYADRLSVVCLPLAALLTRIGWPLAWPLQKLEKHMLVRLISGSDELDRPSPEEAIRSLVAQEGTTDLEEEEREIIESALDFGETVTREIMRPRVDVEGVDAACTIAECVDLVKGSGHSRFPVFEETIDNIQGVVHVKDLLRMLSDGQGGQPLKDVVKTAPFVPESMPINDLLELLRAEQAQMAIVVDEYGGTAGLVTLEDVVEELVGEIHDEYDRREGLMHRLSDGSVVLNARVPVDEANERLDISIPTSEEYDSVGGYVAHALGRIPRPGETISGTDFHITVQTANSRQVHSVRVHKEQRGGEG